MLEHKIYIYICETRIIKKKENSIEYLPIRSSKNNYNFLYYDTREKEIHYRAIIFIKLSTVLLIIL